MLAPGSEAPPEEGVPPGAEGTQGPGCTCPGCCQDDGSGCVEGGVVDGGVEGLPEDCCLVEGDATWDGHGRKHGRWAGWHAGWRVGHESGGGDDGDGWDWGTRAEDNALYLKAEYLLWWTKGNGTPALVTGSTSRGLGAGSLADPNAVVLYGGQRVDTGTFSGARFTAGYWFTDDHALGVEGSFFFLGPNTQSFFLSSNGTPAIFRPFFNDNLGTPDAVRVAFPGLRTGAIAIDQRTRLWGFEANALTSVLDDSVLRLNLLAGLRTVGLDMSQEITFETQRLDRFDTVLSSDKFATRNRFFGGQVGVQAGTNWGPWTFDFTGKVAVGNTRQTVDISGGEILNRGPGPQFAPVGVLAQQSNIGHYTRNVFGVVPEVGLTVGYQINDSVRVYAGYTLLYMNNVALPGAQIDTTLNRNMLPPDLARRLPVNGPTRPLFVFRSQDFWAQGANVGVEFRY
jgi:hypothetical protein